MHSPDLLYVLSLTFGLFFLIREYVAYKRYLPLKYFFTPALTMLLVIIMIFSITINGADRYRIMILLSLLMALAADTLLMIEEINLMKNGMVFFIICHIFYVAAFSSDLSFQLWNLFIIIILLVLNFFYIRLLIKTAGRMLIPVLIYVFVLNLMVYCAIVRLNSSFSVSAMLTASGAILFMISDFILSINAFVTPVRNSTVFTWLLYGPAQLLIVLSTFTTF